jgi:hypothetical protein
MRMRESRADGSSRCPEPAALVFLVADGLQLATGADTIASFQGGDTMRFAHIVHFALMLATLALTYLVPFELLLLAYVVLGPAHYTTEISWLHDRNYFLPRRIIAVALALTAIVAAIINDANWFGFVMWAAFVICAVIAAATTALQATILVMAAFLATGWMLMNGASMAVVGILLPTLIHVSLFTLIFMTLGALRSGERTQWCLIACYLVSIALILTLPPTTKTLVPSFATAATDYFANVAPALSRLFGISGLTLDNRLVGLLAFVYTYHYLNWFIKADVIRWADIPRRRLVLVMAASAGSTALYFYDYAYGFSVLLALSLAHIVLEFPLDAVAMRQLAGAVAGRSTATTTPRA